MILREPTIQDGQALWELAETSRTLDSNSRYAYLMVCRNFRGTSVVADRDGDVLGFVAAYRLPSAPKSLFVWQVTVHPDLQGQGVGGRMLDELLTREGCIGVTELQATVTPSNQSSYGLFRGFAKRHDAECVEEPCFPAELLGDSHEEERLLKIGPLSVRRSDDEHHRTTRV